MVAKIAAWALGVAMLAAPAAISAEPAEALAAAVEPFAADGRFAGVVRVERGAHVLFERAYGQAHVEFEIPNTPQTLFKLHSLSKTFTATAVLRAAADGRLPLDTPICTHLDPCPEEWAPVEVRHLLNHSSGIPDHSNLLLSEFRDSSAATWKRIAPELDAALAAEPGAGFAYSNSGYVLLELILEDVYGASFHEVLQDTIFGPAGMDSAGVQSAPPSGGYDGPLVVKGLASGYNGGPGALQRSYSKMYVIPGAGGVYASAEDVSAFAAALFNGKLLPPAFRQDMVSPDPALETRYAKGIVVLGEGERLQYRHDGGNNGYLSSLQYYPNAELTVIVLSNYGFAPMGEIRGAIADALLPAQE